MSETRDIRIKRLRMRSMRRGIREMDLILDNYAGRSLRGMDDEALDLYEALLGENDHDLYQWISGQSDSPARYRHLVGDITHQLPGAGG